MADLLAKYSDASLGNAAADYRATVLEMNKPVWSKFPETSQHAAAMDVLKVDEKNDKANFNVACAKGCIAALNIKGDAAPLQYILTVVYDILREDSDAFTVFKEALKGGTNIYKPSTFLLELQRDNKTPQMAYIADKVAWLLSALMGRMPKLFSTDQVSDFIKVLSTGTSCTELGVLEAITNLLKSQDSRAAVWSSSGVSDLVFKCDPQTSSSSILYKSVFAIWMASFDASLAANLKSNNVVQKLKSILTFSRTEKVIRLCLTVLKNFLTHKSDCQAICEEIVEKGILEAVQQLEYEKWRDTEVYDEIREVSQLISAEVKDMSNFDRYMKELNSGSLHWGFIHSSKFFGENIMKFDAGDFKAVKMLAELLGSNDAQTLAVACHDIGEFVSLHPLGKKQVARLGVKERVMLLMNWPGADQRDVRREALLCCQKIMLNKWQDVAEKK
jgi:V-type H+-transporting ATPase subunit H